MLVRVGPVRDLSSGQTIAVSTLTAALLLVGAALLAAVGTGDLAARNAIAVAAGDIDDRILASDQDVGSIALRNLGAAAFLAAGAPLLGIATVLGAGVVGMAFGWTFSIALAALGPVELLARVGPYIVLELAGVVVAGAAGLAPVVHAIRGRAHSSILSYYTRGLVIALRLAAVAALLITLGASVEHFVIARA